LAIGQVRKAAKGIASMFGFKKSVTPDQFGEGVLYFANDFITADASRSLGARFENYDASKGWVPVFQAKYRPMIRQLNPL
jgi:hypothetical protein